MAALVLSVPPAHRRSVMVVVAAPATLLTGLATVVAQWHRPSDVLASACLAVASGSVGRVLLGRLERRSRSTPAERSFRQGLAGRPAREAQRPVAGPAHARELIVLAGLPGAGKTTLLRRLAATSPVTALDSEDVARRLSALPLPYRALRPMVHGVHLLRVLLVAIPDARVVLTSDPMTSPVRRQIFRAVAGATGRRLTVVLIHADPAQARDGQRRRGRKLSEPRMRRHEQRYPALRATAGRDAVVLDRASAARVTGLPDLLRSGAPERPILRRPAPDTSALPQHSDANGCRGDGSLVST